MSTLKHKALLAGAFILLIVIVMYSSSVRATPAVTTQADFETVSFDIENAIINRGFVIDFKGDIAKMLVNTSNVTTNTKDDDSAIYQQATFWQFCSSDITRRLVELAPENLRHCPFVIYAYETKKEPGNVYLGYRHVGEPDSNLDIFQEINSLLEAIVSEAR
jgi:hypothetical protein